MRTTSISSSPAAKAGISASSGGRRSRRAVAIVGSSGGFMPCAIGGVIILARRRGLASGRMRKRGDGIPSPLSNCSGRADAAPAKGNRLFGGFRERFDRHIGAAASPRAERHGAVDKGEDRMVAPEPDAGAGAPFGAALADEDVAGENALATELLYAETLAGGIAAVARRAACFLMGHRGISYSLSSVFAA